MIFDVFSEVFNTKIPACTWEKFPLISLINLWLSRMTGVYFYIISIYIYSVEIDDIICCKILSNNIRVLSPISLKFH